MGHRGHSSTTRPVRLTHGRHGRRRSSTRTSCGPTSRSSTSRSTGSRWRSSTRPSLSQKPRQVLDAMREFYETSYSNVHRGVYTLSERATEGYEGAREKVRAFLNAGVDAGGASSSAQATEGLNLVAYAWGLDNLGPGDSVLVTELEHHSNFVPWQQIAKRTGAEFRMIPIDDQGELRMDLLDEVAGEGRVKVVAANLVSNSLGTINPIEKLAAWAHERGAIMVVRRGAGRTAPADGRPDARCRLRRLLVAQDVRPDRGRRALGPPGAARGDVAVQLRRLDDPVGQGRGDALERAAVQVRGRHAGDRGGLRARDRDRLPRGGRARGDRGARARARRLRAGAAGRAPVRHRPTAHRRTAASGSSPSTWTASIRTTSRRSSTGRGSRSAPATTAASR